MTQPDPDYCRNQIRVLIYVQLKRRDLFGMKKLATALAAEKGFSVLLSGTSDFPLAVLAFRPHIVVFGKPDNAEGDWLRCMSGCVVVSLNAEQGGDPWDRVKANFLNKHNSVREQALDHVDHHLIVDEQTRNFLVPYIDPERLHLVGYPRLFRQRFARTPNPVNDRMAIGVACANSLDNKYLLDLFRLKQDSGFEPWANVETYITQEVLEYLWVNRLVDQLKSRYRIIVRYRSQSNSSGTYLFDESGVELDTSETLEYLFNNVDLLLVGRSTVAIEALMFGIPAITVSALFRVGEVGSRDLRIPRLLWQPENLDEFLEMVDRRSRGDLGLSPDLEAYEALVRPSYFCGGEVDHSIENIVNVIKSCEPGTGAVLDRQQFHKLLDPSATQRFLLWFAAAISSRLTYRCALIYLRLRRKWLPDAYLVHEAFIPETGSKVQPPR